jgi:protein-tyrosine kinase
MNVETSVRPASETPIAMPDLTQTDPATEAASIDSRHRLSPSVSVLSEPGGARAESIGSLRTHLLAQHVRDGRRSLAICSATAGAGCSYVATNLAAAMAMAGIKTLLIDANLRDPGLEAFIEPVAQSGQPQPGLSQYLSDPTIEAGDIIHNDVLSNLSVIYAGAATANAQELLASAGFKQLFDDCMRDFDLTIIDTPPSSICADARRVAAVARHALIVVRRHRGFVSDVKTLGEELKADHANVVGTFLNDY